MKSIVLIVAVFIVSSCGSTFTGPITGTKYNVDLGCTDDMQKYHTQREELIGDKNKESQNAEKDCFTQEGEMLKAKEFDNK